MKRKINQIKRACKYAYSVIATLISTIMFFFNTFMGNEDWWDCWGHRNRRQWKIESSDLSSAKRSQVVRQMLQIKLQLLR